MAHLPSMHCLTLVSWEILQISQFWLSGNRCPRPQPNELVASQSFHSRLDSVALLLFLGAGGRPTACLSPLGNSPWLQPVSPSKHLTPSSPALFIFCQFLGEGGSHLRSLPNLGRMELGKASRRPAWWIEGKRKGSERWEGKNCSSLTSSSPLTFRIPASPPSDNHHTVVYIYEFLFILLIFFQFLMCTCNILFYI